MNDWRPFVFRNIPQFTNKNARIKSNKTQFLFFRMYNMNIVCRIHIVLSPPKNKCFSYCIHTDRPTEAIRSVRRFLSGSFFRRCCFSFCVHKSLAVSSCLSRHHSGISLTSVEMIPSLHRTFLCSVRTMCRVHCTHSRCVCLHVILLADDRNNAAHEC